MHTILYRTMRNVDAGGKSKLALDKRLGGHRAILALLAIA
jgi:hypothetical protein